MSKTYLEMGDEDKKVISALYFVKGWGPKKISEYIDWPWQSVNAHIKVLEDRIKMGSANENQLVEEGTEYLKVVEIHEEPVTVSRGPIHDEPEMVIPIDNVKITVAPITSNTPLVANVTIKDLYIATLESFINRIQDGVIIPQGMSVSDVNGEFYLQFGSAV